ncbi:FAD:protein FMN transferase [Metabacillus sp. GX 13764]|uniref:FAD:protein FMN transferase n=1 Tax=Metabacillus kandeliae TaxID=2900151 RepID=UPI001E478401|nr:FAD:protein FMN transferase [Metabacillus kandeliae]MCD7036072.1 FAD:protein FMN transferase [Metabacillus kandeliae]
MQAVNKQEVFTKASIYMDTTVTIQVVLRDSNIRSASQAVQRAFLAFRHVEQVCSRFSSDSEVMQLIKKAGTPQPASDTLFEAVRFALAVAKETNGAFDPAIGGLMEDYGFNRHYLTRKRQHSDLAEKDGAYTDIELDEAARTILLKKPLILDLGAVAKGLAIDLAAMELNKFEGFLINAGGDIYAGGLNEHGEKWKVGIQDPAEKDKLAGTIELSNKAICTSGSYARRSPVNAAEHHLMHPSLKKSAGSLVSCTVLAPFAMMADAFSAAAFILGPDNGKALLERAGLQGMLIEPSFHTAFSKGMEEVLG